MSLSGDLGLAVASSLLLASSTFSPGQRTSRVGKREVPLPRLRSCGENPCLPTVGNCPDCTASRCPQDVSLTSSRHPRKPNPRLVLFSALGPTTPVGVPPPGVVSDPDPRGFPGARGRVSPACLRNTPSLQQLRRPGSSHLARKVIGTC